MDRLIALYKSTFGLEPTQTKAITGSGSPRQYYRLSDHNYSAIGVIGSSLEENNAFIGLTRHFESRSLPVPHIYAVTSDHMGYLQTDLGTTSLYDAIASGRKDKGNYSEHEQNLLHLAIAQLPRMQIVGAQGFDTSLCYPIAAMDSTSILFDLNYFKYCFLKLIPSLDFNELKLQADFDSLTTDILNLCKDSDSLILRDCQARNIMLSNTGEPHFIDYQGCRLGPVEYDLASFLWQASARYSPSLRVKLVDTYITHLSELRPTDHAKIKSNLRLMVLFRTLQVLGAYGFRGYIEHKSYFLNSIPSAIANLADIIDQQTCQPYPYLQSLLQQVVAFINAQEEAKKRNLLPPTQKTGSPPLTVTIWSFSYKKGIPTDPSGNGGGYVFDCRSTHNPGLYAPYKKQTGLDAPVIQFLEEDAEILTFLSHIYPIVEHHTERFIQRGFTNLTICFGCTGGQHRSVYSAQHVAQHLHNLYPNIHIHLIHREQGIDINL